MSVSVTKFVHDRARIICEKYGDTLSHDEYDALALVAIAYDAGAPITQEQLNEAMSIIERVMTE